MPRPPKIRHDSIHANPILISTVPRHIRPIPLERHRHLPQILRNVVERLVELAHRHGVHVVDAVCFHLRGVGEAVGGALQHGGGYAGGAGEVVDGHLGVGLEGGVGEVGGEGEGLGKLAGVLKRLLGGAYLIETVEIGVEDHAF
jgi:hypothetical protein